MVSKKDRRDERNRLTQATRGATVGEETAPPAAETAAVAEGEGIAAAEEAEEEEEVPPEVQIAEALDFITRQGRTALQGIYELVESEPDSRTLAQAYDSALEAHAKEALLFLRDVLVLKVCLSGGPWGHDKLVAACSAPMLFNRTMDPQLSSQVCLAFNTIVHCGLLQCFLWRKCTGPG